MFLHFIFSEACFLLASSVSTGDQAAVGHPLDL